MRKGRLAVLILCLMIVATTGCSLSHNQRAETTEGQHTTMQLGNVSAISIEATNLPGRLDIQTGKNDKDFEALFPSKVQSNVERQDRNFFVAVTGLEESPDAQSRVVLPIGKEMSIGLVKVARPLEIVIDYASAKQLRASNITAPLTVKVLTNSNLAILLESGNSPVQLALPEGAEVRVQGSMKAEQIEALTQLGFIKEGSAWIRTTRSTPTATVQLQVEGWTGAPRF